VSPDDYPFERPDGRDEDPFDPGPEELGPESARPGAPHRNEELFELWKMVYGPRERPRAARDGEDWYV
jgi:hypothetical protein